ncbi:MAG TPA: methyltransferase domain-containing protein [Bryobacteraceae bacterium]|nr:methyltransferase domain-containing protein [Bryobacteraceae bacterium]
MNAETAPFEYAGTELHLFEKARNWKSYWRNQVAPYVGGDVLEVGAGIGANTKLLASLSHDRWTSLEPDTALASQIEKQSQRHRILTSTIAGLPAEERFNTILYIDVLEHIEGDSEEMRDAAARLRPGGHLIVLAPAHPFLYTPFDAAIGHFRRYTRASLRAAAPKSLHAVRIIYLDCAGMLASAANRMLLRSAMPTERQILTWDGWLVPVSRVLDPLFGWRIGKSVIGIWRLGN